VAFATRVRKRVASSRRRRHRIVSSAKLNGIIRRRGHIAAHGILRILRCACGIDMYARCRFLSTWIARALSRHQRMPRTRSGVINNGGCILQRACNKHFMPLNIALAHIIRV